MRAAWIVMVVGMGCADTATLSDDDLAADLWDAIADRASWDQPSKWQGVQPSNDLSPHGPYAEIHGNSIAAANFGATHDDGAVLTKDIFEDADGTMARNVFAMQKIDGYDPDNGDWFWVRYDLDGSAVAAGAVGGCYGCHEDGTDHSFVDLEPGSDE